MINFMFHVIIYRNLNVTVLLQALSYSKNKDEFNTKQANYNVYCRVLHCVAMKSNLKWSIEKRFRYCFTLQRIVTVLSDLTSPLGFTYIDIDIIKSAPWHS